MRQESEIDNVTSHYPAENFSKDTILQRLFNLATSNLLVLTFPYSIRHYRTKNRYGSWPFQRRSEILIRAKNPHPANIRFDAIAGRARRKIHYDNPRC